MNWQGMYLKKLDEIQTLVMELRAQQYLQYSRPTQKGAESAPRSRKFEINRNTLHRREHLEKPTLREFQDFTISTIAFVHP